MLSELQMAIAWIGIFPFRTPGKKDKPLMTSALEADRDEKAGPSLL